MTDITTGSSANGTVTTQSNGLATEVNDIQIKNPEGVLAKNKELIELVKKEKQAKADMAQRLQELEQAKMQAEGKKEELIAQLQSQIKQKEAELKTKTAKFAFKSVTEKASRKAAELGCINPELLLKALDLEQLKVSVVDEDSFDVDLDSLNGQLEQARKSMPYLFKQAGPQIKDGVPSAQGMQKTGEVDFSKMTTAQLIDYAKKNPDKIK
jgi:membrane-bound lytic murein transglycosylase